MKRTILIIAIAIVVVAAFIYLLAAQKSNRRPLPPLIQEPQSSVPSSAQSAAIDSQDNLDQALQDLQALGK